MEEDLEEGNEKSPLFTSVNIASHSQPIEYGISKHYPLRFNQPQKYLLLLVKAIAAGAALVVVGTFYYFGWVFALIHN